MIGISWMHKTMTKCKQKSLHQKDKIKKVWHKPTISDYGHVSELTAGTVGSHTDKGHCSNHHGGG
ncbi:MAG TPA: hypothetical protein VKT27_13510 [Candidatus Binataceae bacterium]|nr:hypothetical protein [Candidatus Binataceae bacterium]